MKREDSPKRDATDPDSEFVGLEKLDPEADPSEVPLWVSTDPELDSPGDDAILDQEELMEGLSSGSMPSESLERGEKREQ